MTTSKTRTIVIKINARETYQEKNADCIHCTNHFQRKMSWKLSCWLCVYILASPRTGRCSLYKVDCAILVILVRHRYLHNVGTV